MTAPTVTCPLALLIAREVIVTENEWFGQLHSTIEESALADIIQRVIPASGQPAPDATPETDSLEDKAPNAVWRIDNYLQSGGLFNPEMMEHDKVRDVMIHARTELKRIPILERQRDEALKQIKVLKAKLSARESVIEMMNRINNTMDTRYRAMLAAQSVPKPKLPDGNGLTGQCIWKEKEPGHWYLWMRDRWVARAIPGIDGKFFWEHWPFLGAWGHEDTLEEAKRQAAACFRVTQ